MRRGRLLRDGVWRRLGFDGSKVGHLLLQVLDQALDLACLGSQQTSDQPDSFRGRLSEALESGFHLLHGGLLLGQRRLQAGVDQLLDGGDLPIKQQNDLKEEPKWMEKTFATAIGREQILVRK